MRSWQVDLRLQRIVVLGEEEWALQCIGEGGGCRSAVLVPGFAGRRRHRPRRPGPPLHPQHHRRRPHVEKNSTPSTRNPEPPNPSLLHVWITGSKIDHGSRCRFRNRIEFRRVGGWAGSASSSSRRDGRPGSASSILHLRSSLSCTSASTGGAWRNPRPHQTDEVGLSLSLARGGPGGNQWCCLEGQQVRGPAPAWLLPGTGIFQGNSGRPCWCRIWKGDLWGHFPKVWSSLPLVQRLHVDPWTDSPLFPACDAD